MADTPLTNPGVRFPPPLLFAGGLGGGWLLHRFVPLPLLRPTALWREPAGLALAVVGLLVTFWAIFTFTRARTAIIPHRAASRLVAHGPYRFSRNPMYVGLTVAYLGGALLIDSTWPIVLLPLVILALLSLVIEREERYLHAAFGDDYAAYRRRVRRWL